MIPFLAKWKMSSVECALKMYKREDLKGELCVGVPEFASNFLFELSQDSLTNELFVKATYNKNIPIKNLCQNPDEKDNQYSCKYEDFKASMTNNFMWSNEERKKACTKTNPSSKKDEESSINLWFLVSIVLSLVILVLVCGLIFFLMATKRIEQEVEVDDEEANRNDFRTLHEV